jgi:hypothetical protein
MATSKAQKPQFEATALNPSPERESVVEITRLTKSFGNFDATVSSRGCPTRPIAERRF